MKRIREGSLLIGITGALLVSAPAISAETASVKDMGQREYQQSCASCHGPDGKGKGSVADALQLSMPDLTTLSKRNGGVFPFARVYEVIDGTQDVKAHGTREMPVWGKHFARGAAPAFDDYGYNPDAAARGRILTVTDYIYRIQAK